MFSLDSFPIDGKRSMPLCKVHGNTLEKKEVVLFNVETTQALPPDHCWVCDD